MATMSVLPLPKQRKPKEGSVDVLDALKKAIEDYRYLRQRVRAIDDGSVIPIDENQMRENLERAGVTKSERRVLSYVFEGWPNAQIAAEIGIKQATVRAHLSHARKKLGIARSESLAPALLGLDGRNLIIKSLIG